MQDPSNSALTGERPTGYLRSLGPPGQEWQTRGTPGVHGLQRLGKKGLLPSWDQRVGSTCPWLGLAAGGAGRFPTQCLPFRQVSQPAGELTSLPLKTSPLLCFRVGRAEPLSKGFWQQWGAIAKDPPPHLARGTIRSVRVQEGQQAQWPWRGEKVSNLGLV